MDKKLVSESKKKKKKPKKTTMIITVTTIMIIFKISWSSEKAPLDHLFCSRVSFWSYM